MKRFYQQVAIGSDYNILLDGKAIKTPAKTLLILPTRALAEAVASEWQMQGEKIEPQTMPLTRHANTVIDRITQHRDAVIAEIAKFGGTDMICYRASGPADLVARQCEAWDPLLEFARAQLGAPLRATAGISAIAQAPEVLQALEAAVAAHDNWQLAALHDAVSISGSVVIGLALSHGHLAVGQAWAAGQLDELYQIERWGEDDLAATARKDKREALEVAARLFHLLRQS
jgi:chaperone required for assembly of F1-ATPase